MVVLDRALGDIGENGIGASECDHRHLAEEDRDLTENIAGAKRGKNSYDRHQPKREPYSRDRQRTRHRRVGVLGQFIPEQTRLVAMLSSG